MMTEREDASQTGSQNHELANHNNRSLTPPASSLAPDEWEQFFTDLFPFVFLCGS